jgi:acetylornithine deacetylase/succinyl-diaminopimelate desuccinylase-like protein
VERVVEYLKKNRAAHLEWARDLCRIPSISTKPEHKGDVRKSVEWTRDLCRSIGMTAEIHETGGHPLVYAEWCGAPSAPTYLVYGHVDVQPVGDPKLWDADAFDPVVKGDWLICRGSSDDKGQVLLYIRAAAAWLATAGKLPINLKMLIEGEEEIGSPNLAPFIEKNAALLKCDGILISDTGMHEDGLPTVTVATRGLVYKEVRLFGPKLDLHSGSHGGAAPNPAILLSRMIASLHDADGRVTIPGYYDQVVELMHEHRREMAAIAPDEAKYAADLGVSGLSGETGYTALERRTVRPTLEVNGLTSGFQGEGANTIIPAKASAKISMRLVANQNAAELSRRFDETIRDRCPKTVRCEILTHGSAADAYMAPVDGAAIKAARRALKEAFGREAALIREGGTLPILPMFKRVLRADSLMLGFASPSCNAHGPNEKVRIPDLDLGAESVARLFQHLAG